jgi:hypothetical protein
VFTVQFSAPFMTARYNKVPCVGRRDRVPADQYLGTIMTIVYCGSRSMKTDIYRSRILCTVYDAVDFLIVPYKGL